MASVYLHKRKDTNEVFYVGITINEKRPYSKKGRNNHWHNIVKKVGYYVEITHIGLIWDEACSIEKYLISFYGRRDLSQGNLCNMTDGGEGTINPSIEQRQKISLSNKGKKKPEGWALRMKSWLCVPSVINSRKTTKGYKMSDKQKEILKNVNIGKKHKKETIDKIRESNTGEKNKFYGKNHTEDTKFKMKNSHKNMISVIQLDLSDRELNRFVSLQEASRISKVRRASISDCIKGIYKKAGGYKWKLLKIEK